MDEEKDYSYSADITVANDDLEHYGMPRRSGRYPWGSGKDPYQHSKDFYGRVKEMRKNKFTYTDPKTGEKYTGDKAIYKSMGMTSGDFRTELAIAKDEEKIYNRKTAEALKRDGLNTSEIARKMGVNESTVRGYFKQDRAKMYAATNTAKKIKELVDKNGMMDIGANVNVVLGVSENKMKEAIRLLEQQGYVTYKGGIPNVTNQGVQTNQVVLCKPGTKYKDIYDFSKVKSFTDENVISRDNGDTFEERFHYPESLDSKRLKIRYSEEGGLERDGLIEIRRGVKDLSLGNDNYSQVRIMVDGTHYLKGMAVYSDGKDMPDGVDVIFNTNKAKGTDVTKVLKEIKDDPKNPFGSAIKPTEEGGQYWYTDVNGKKKLGLINKTRGEGDWTDWQDTLPSQFLSKQSKELAKRQLDLAKADKQDEFNDIMSIDNPTIKKFYLKKFADGCDKAAIDLKAAALPGQKYHVMIPLNSLKDTEIYAPQYENGTKLALIRYPHAGTFEIPILTVNNKNKDGDQIIGKQSIDAVGLTKKNADRLSGADYDGDTVMCIPTGKGHVKIINQEPLKELEGFDPSTDYATIPKTINGKTEYYDGNGRRVSLMKESMKQKEMGMISNLITDMSLAGAPPEDMARAAKHSMVVIDAVKHKLDYRKSAIDNDIEGLKKKYRGYIDEDGNFKVKGGAATLISAAKGQTHINKKRGSYYVNVKGKPGYDPSRPEGAAIWKDALPKDLYYVKKNHNKTTGTNTIETVDGKKITYNPKDKGDYEKYNPVLKVNDKTGEVSFTSPDGKLKYKYETRTQTSTNMADTDDAKTLVSKAKHPMELIYADYANSMKSLANKARLAMVNTGNLKYNKEARDTYAQEYASLNSKLNDALKNSVKERAAMRQANTELNQRVAAIEEQGGEVSKKDRQKIGQQAITQARADVGSLSRRKRNIEITDREWEAIQKGAFTENQLSKILDNADPDQLRDRATPKNKIGLSDAKIARINRMAESNYTLAEIANRLGVSTSTVSKALKGA